MRSPNRKHVRRTRAFPSTTPSHSYTSTTSSLTLSRARARALSLSLSHSLYLTHTSEYLAHSRAVEDDLGHAVDMDREAFEELHLNFRV